LAADAHACIAVLRAARMSTVAVAMLFTLIALSHRGQVVMSMAKTQALEPGPRLA
jgi:hypothetical protein